MGMSVREAVEVLGRSDPEAWLVVASRGGRLAPRFATLAAVVGVARGGGGTCGCGCGCGREVPALVVLERAGEEADVVMEIGECEGGASDTAKSEGTMSS